MRPKTEPSGVDSLLQRLDAQDMEIQRVLAVGEAEKTPETRRRSRRDIFKLAGAAVVGAAGAAAMRVVPAAAANGDPVTVGGSFTGTLPTHITNSSGTGFIATGGAASVGLQGISSGSQSVGVSGVSDFGDGVDGVSTFGTAVSGVASSGTGVYAFGAGFGLYGTSNYANGIGVNGVAPGTGGIGGYFGGGRAQIGLSPSISAGPPPSNAHSRGDIWADVHGILWTCVTSGTPGVFAPLQTGRANLTHFVKVSNKQYTLANSDGMTWMDMDATGLAQVITPLFDAQAVISISVDLWTKDSGFNQDIGIFISGGGYGTGQIVAWKESGGFAGTFSPNAAFVETTQPFAAGTTYTIKVRWKANKPASGATIFAGAGPLPVGSAGGGVAGQYSPTRLAAHLVVDVPSPLTLQIPANDPSAVPPMPRLPVKPSRPLT